MAVDRSALDQQNLLDAQASVLGSMLIDSRCVGAVLAEVGRSTSRSRHTA